MIQWKISLCFLVLMWPCYVWAYRPFVSTDASVADQNKWGIELGSSFEHKDEEDQVIVPELTANYGLGGGWEAVVEGGFQVYRQEKERANELLDPSLSIKKVLKEGILQSKQGPSLAGELGLFLPSTLQGEGRTGVSGVGILSEKTGNFLYHLNLGAELDRSGLGPNGVWGVILEYPFEGGFRLVGEINGVIERRGPPDTSGLLGFIWKLHGIDWDFGVRKGFSDIALDWGLTTGITWLF